jgi:HKD family nuclease
MFISRSRRPARRPAPLPGLPHDGPLISGGSDALHGHLLPWIDAAVAIDLSVSFLMTSGLQLVLPHLEDLLARGGRLRLLTGDYLHVTEPDALRRIADLQGGRTLHIFEAARIPFHPKAWMFGFPGGDGALIVGSSNLSRAALTEGVEWNLRHFGPSDGAPLVAARTAFDALLARPEVRPLTPDWIERYEKRHRPPAPQASGAPEEPTAAAPTPHEVQAEALEALTATRARGYGAGLVVLATRLGKTYLDAFDSQTARRVLFVAHREEILTQAMAAFRAVRPKARLGRYGNGATDADAEIVFASVQTLGRQTHLERFAADAFDYIVVDAFHHAAAATYRRIIDHFTPDFLLGLTATPDRSDGGDLLGLCEENLVYTCDLWSGIDRGLLSPFKYFGVPDPVEYAQIPWRSGKFDEAALTEAVATRARAENALDQLARRGGEKTIGFCVSRRHADFMAVFATERGLRAVAVHSGESSAPRASALKALEAGDLDILRALIRRPRDGDELTAFYRDFRERNGTRPTASAVQHAGFNAARTGHEGWFGFVADMGDLTGEAHAAWQAHRDLLDEIETMRMTRSYKMLVLRAMIEAGAFPGRIGLDDLVARVARAARRNPAIAADLSADPGDYAALRRVLLDQPLKIHGETRWFRRGPGTFETTMVDTAPALTRLASELVDWRLTRYLQDKQRTFAEPPSSQPSEAAEEGAEAPTAPAGPQPWAEYPRERIAPLFGATFNTGAWNAGIVVLREARAMILLVTMDKGGLATGNHYADRFDGPRRFVWQTQTSTRRNSERGRIISGHAPHWTIHLFVRKSKLRDGRAAPFRYAGPVTFADWEGEAPITVHFDLAEAVPSALRNLYGIADG